jgi:hypothetical protein
MRRGYSRRELLSTAAKLGSVLPTSGGYNPTLTIQALAWRTAARIARAN